MVSVQQEVARVISLMDLTSLNDKDNEQVIAEGKVLHALPNKVLVDRLTHDPTAHGERQLIDWYYEQLAQGRALPKTSELTIVSSLDPCCMCTGSILSSGMKVVVAAFDDYAGINHDQHTAFPTLTNETKAQAKKCYSYPAVGEGEFTRCATGAPLPSFFSTIEASSKSLARCHSAFSETAGAVKAKINQDVPFSELRNPCELAADDPLLLAIKAVYPQALEYQAPARAKPDAKLAPFLRAAMREDRENGGTGEAVAFLDGFGNLLLCLSGHRARSPLLTPFMRATHAYADLRERLIKNSAVGEAKTRRYLGHPKHGVFVFTQGPNDSAASLIDLGAFGSTMEGALPADNPRCFQYLKPQMEEAHLHAYCQHLPPFYSHLVGVKPWSVEDPALVSAIYS